MIQININVCDIKSYYQQIQINTIYMYSGITSGRVLNGELLYTKILEVNLFAFAYRLFRRDFSPLDGTYCIYAICPVQSIEKPRFQIS